VSTLRRRPLQLDDPLSQHQPAEGNEPAAEGGPATASQAGTSRPVEETDRLSEDGQRGEPEPGRDDQTVAPDYTTARMPQPANREPWRAWSGITGVGSFRLPHELLVELGESARGLGLPIGMIVTAAITQLLDQPPEQIAALVDRADDARIHARRTARRRLTERPEG
jgi:hypothetical protein